MWSWLLAKRLPRLLMSAFWVKLGCICGLRTLGWHHTSSTGWRNIRKFFFPNSPPLPAHCFCQIQPDLNHKTKKQRLISTRGFKQSARVFMQEMMDWCTSLIMQDTAPHLFFFYVAKALSRCVFSIRIKSHRCHKSQAMCTLTMSTVLDLLTSDCVLSWIKNKQTKVLCQRDTSLNNSRRTFELLFSGGESHEKKAAT